MTSNVVLIGMPAAGKSTVGVIAAKLLAYDFLDTDLLIQRHCGQTLESIIKACGLDGFLAIENQLCSEISAEETVIATGGSVIYGVEAMANLKSLGTVIHLDVPFDTLSARLNDIHSRGVVIRTGQTLEDLYAERTALYSKYADATVKACGSIEDTVRAVVAAL